MNAGMNRRSGLLLVLYCVWWGLTATAATMGCGALRQNLRNQFVSYRGAWHCESAGCDESSMKRSAKNHREGEVNITHVSLQPAAAMVFYPGTPVQSFTATVECGGQTADVPSDKVEAPGTHGISGEPDSWIVVIEASDYAMSGCNTWRVTTHATWADGSTYEEKAGIQVGG